MANWAEYGITIVGEAVHGKQALSMALVLKPDVALVDVSMPVMDGIEFARIVAEEKLGVKLIMLSCRDEISYVKQAMKAGASDYILKNEVDLQLLLSTINNTVVKKDMLPDKQNTGDSFAQDSFDKDISTKEIRDAIEYIHENYHKNISLDDVARKVNLSKVYLSQLFLQVTKMNFSKFILDLRLLKAKNLLKDTNMKVYSIAEKVGFNNQYYFIKVFTKKYGISPKKYRNNGS